MKNDLCDGTQAVAASEGILRTLARKTGIDKKNEKTGDGNNYHGIQENCHPVPEGNGYWGGRVLKASCVFSEEWIKVNRNQYRIELRSTE